MNKSPLFFLLGLLGAVAQGVQAQGAPSGPPALPGDMPGQGMRLPVRQFDGDERMERREEMRQRRDTWRQMSPEERHQFRSDIRDAGRSIYPRRNRGN